MADRYTSSGDVFKPERIADVIKDYAFNQLAIFQSGAIKPLNVDFSTGNVVTFPVATGFASGLSTLSPTDTTGAVPGDVKYTSMTTETKALISKWLGIGMNGCSLEDAYASGDFNLIDSVLEQASLEFAKEIDLSIITEAESTDLSYTAGAGSAISRQTIIRAKAKWGDMSGGPAILVVHSAVYADLLDEVKDYNVLGQANTTAMGGLPTVFGMPVVVSDNVSVSGGVYTNLLVKPAGLGFAFKRDLTYKAVDLVGDKTVHEFTARWVSKLLRQNGKKNVVKFTTISNAD